MPLVPEFSMPEKDIARFHTKYEKTDGCWNWTARCDKGGYGSFKLNGKTVLAHKIALFLKTGKYYFGKDDLIGCHRCKKNTGCVNPAHLDWKTNSENNGADVKRDGTINPPKGERVHTAKLTEAKVLEIRQKYATKEYTHQGLADEYDVVKSAIGYIIRRKTWKHI